MASKPNNSSSSSDKPEDNNSELEAMKAEIERLRLEKEVLQGDLNKERQTKELQDKPVREYMTENGMLIRDY